MPRQPSSTTKAQHWLLTIPHHEFQPYLPDTISYLKCQLEEGQGTGFLHWQVYLITKVQCRLSTLKHTFPTAHIEATRSAAAAEYVWKEETRVENTQYELGELPFKRNNANDWKRLLDNAKRSNWDAIPAQLYIAHYRSLKAIACENAKPVAMERTIYVFWGRTGSGKSRRAWGEAGLGAYPKDPCSKFWDGYREQANVVIDEFRGSIGISHILRWFDRYPVIVEVKGSSIVLQATHIWITSNLHPKDWYPDIDDETKNALLRRLTITHFE